MKGSDLTNADIYALHRSLCDSSFYYFLQTFWDVIIQEDPVWNWHIPYLCDELQRVGQRIIDRKPKEYDLIINVPPGSSKSTIATVAFPVWLWTKDPTLRVITGSYSGTLGMAHAMLSRDIIRSDRFRAMYPGIEMKVDKDNKSYYGNTEGGERVSTSVGGSITGIHAHCIIVDDPLNPTQASSEAERTTANYWMDTTLATRKVDKKITPTIVIMQRLHEKDVTGHWLSKKGKSVRHICLPGKLDDNVNPPELRERYVDGLLDPVRLDIDTLSELHSDLGDYAYAGQIQQRPAPSDGGYIKRDYFGYGERIPEDMIWNFTIDPAYTSKEENDPSALMAYAVDEFGNTVIRNVESVRLEFPELLKYIQKFVNDNGYTNKSRIYVEPKASGKSIVQTLKRETGLNVMESKPPDRDKVARVQDVLPAIEAGRVHLIRGRWNEAFINQCVMFPNASHDDEVDCLVMALQQKNVSSFFTM